MAQLGDLVRAKALLRSAARAFGPKEAVARAQAAVSFVPSPPSMAASIWSALFRPQAIR